MAPIVPIQNTVQNHIERQDRNGQRNTNKFNTQRQNSYLCNNCGYFTLLLSIFLIVFLSTKIIDNIAHDDWGKMQLMHNLTELILNVIIPICVCVTNKKLYKHIKTEIFNCQPNIAPE